MATQMPATSARPFGSRAGLLGAFGVAVGAAMWLTFAAPRPLALPGDDDVAEWFAEVGLLGATMTGLRLVVIVLAGWVAIIALVHLLPATTDLARRITPPTLLPLCLALGSACTTTPASPAAETADLVPLGPATLIPSSTTVSAAVTTATGSEVKATLLTDRQLSRRHGPPSAQQSAPSPAGQTEAWTVAPGDHLWSIAASTLEDAWHRTPTDLETEPYWRALIVANEHRLLDPANPDLIVPGQRLDIPAVPPQPA